MQAATGNNYYNDDGFMLWKVQGPATISSAYIVYLAIFRLVGEITNTFWNNQKFKISYTFFILTLKENYGM